MGRCLRRHALQGRTTRAQEPVHARCVLQGSFKASPASPRVCHVQQAVFAEEVG